MDYDDPYSITTTPIKPRNIDFNANNKINYVKPILSSKKQNPNPNPYDNKNKTNQNSLNNPNNSNNLGNRPGNNFTVFNPYAPQPKQEEEEELKDLPEFVDLSGETKNPLHDDPDYEIPLLEELGVNPTHIKEKMFSILLVWKKIDRKVLAETDMAGPFFIFILFGIGLLLVR